MSLKKEIDSIYLLILELERRQRSGEASTEQEVQNLKSLTLTLECIAESMVPDSPPAKGKGKGKAKK
jgi:hypothetical protein